MRMNGAGNSDRAARAVITAGADTITFTGVTRASLIASHVDGFLFV